MTNHRATRVGALVSKAHFDKVCGYLNEGQRVHMGGKSRSGTHVEPTVMDVDPVGPMILRPGVPCPIET